MDKKEHFQQCADYLDSSYEAWKSVFDSYDQLLRTFRSLAPQLTSEITEMLKDSKQRIEEKKLELEATYDANVLLVQSGRNVQETPPLGFRIDFNLTKLFRAAWPTTNQPALPPPPTFIPPPEVNPEINKFMVQPPVAAAPGNRAALPPIGVVPPPGFADHVSRSYASAPSARDRVISWVQSSAPPPQPQVPSSQELSDAAQQQALYNTLGLAGAGGGVAVAEDDDDDEFETFGTKPTVTSANVNNVGFPTNNNMMMFGAIGQQVPPKPSVAPPAVFSNPPPAAAAPIKGLGRLSDLDDFDTFGESIPQKRPQQQPSTVPSSHHQYEEKQPNQPSTVDDPARSLETLRCVDFLTNKIKQKFGDQGQQAALTKIYGHLSNEEAYRLLIGGSKDFPGFLARFPEYFRLSSDQNNVILLKDAAKKSTEAVRAAEKALQLAEQQAKSKQAAALKSFAAQQQQPQQQQQTVKKTSSGPPPGLSAKSAKAKPSLMDMDDYGASEDDDDDSGNYGRQPQKPVAVVPTAAAAIDAFDDDEFDTFGPPPSASNNKPAVAAVKSVPAVVVPTQRPSSTSILSNKQPLTYWEIVEMVVKRLDLTKRFETYDIGKQVAVEAVKLAMQAHDMTTNFGQMEPELMVRIVDDFIQRGHEAFKHELDLAQLDIPKKTFDEWKLKTILCSDFAANSHCPRGSTCNFAHGKNDLRPRRRVKLCSSFLAGACRKAADECQNAHGREYLGSIMPGQEHLLGNLPPPTAASSSSSTMAPAAAAAATAGKNLAPAPAPVKSHWKANSSVVGGGGGGGVAPASATGPYFQDTDHSCAICFDPMRNANDVQQLRCGHRFHAACIAQWKPAGNGQCPKCRIAIVDEADFPSLT